MLLTNHPYVTSRSIHVVPAAAHHGVVLRIWMRNHDRSSGLLGHKLEAVRHFDADGGEVKQLVDDRVLAQIGAGRIAPRITLASFRSDIEHAADALVRVLRQRFRT